MSPRLGQSLPRGITARGKPIGKDLNALLSVILLKAFTLEDSTNVFKGRLQIPLWKSDLG